MSQCKICNKSGFFLSADKNGVCSQCGFPFYSQVKRSFEIIKESEKLINESKNYSTRLSRCDLIRKILMEFYAHEKKGISFSKLLKLNIVQTLQEAEEMRCRIIDDAIMSSYEDIIAKVNVASSPKIKINACNNGILKLRELAKDVGYHPEIQRIAGELKKQAHILGYKSFIDAAQKAEFKDNLKKALDQYQEALYFLKTDEIDDSKQQDTIASLEVKIDELKHKMGTSQNKRVNPKKIVSDGL